MPALRTRSHAIVSASAVIVTLLVAGCASQRQPMPEIAPPPAPAPRATPAPAAPKPVRVEVRPTAPTRYVVQKGDTLWDLSKRFLYNPWSWPEIWYANPQIKNPHWIYPGDVLTLYYVNGQPRVSVTGGPRVTGISTIVLKPGVQYEKLPSAEHPIPIQTIRPFLIHPRVVPVEQMLKAPHVVGSSEDRILFGNGDQVYVRGLPAKPKSSVYSLYRPGAVLRSPKTGRIIAHEVTYLGDIRIIHDGPVATGVLEKVTRAVHPGDRLLPYAKKDLNYTFMPQAPKVKLDGQIISLFNAISMVAQYQVVVLDIGTQQGVRKGDVVALEQHGRLIQDDNASPGESRSVRLPNSRSGVAMVFRAFDHISYALVMSSIRPIEIGDVATNP
ncbi:MAG: LysM peptidoglycan-binding domain-containing protein [Acidihalobacter sp.]|uniref:LysM peptidoglycan-binding domain-containing protein n=1 Tax=Acidihalobacter sp. TaxID=1872108 RepID=UPI00307D76B8